MNKTYFAELKEKLVSLDYPYFEKWYSEVLQPSEVRPFNDCAKVYEHFNAKSAAIISELIDIISYQESLIESNFKRSKETAIWIEKKQFENDEYDGEWYVKSTEPFNELEIIRENCKEALSETTARLQKLRDGK